MTEQQRRVRDSALYAARKLVRNAVLRLAGLFTVGRGKPISNPRRILILQLQQLGDSVVFSPTLRALRERFPHAEIDLFASPVASQLYAKSPYPDRIFVADGWGSAEQGARLWPITPTIRLLRARKYDCVVADATQHSFKYALIAFAIGAPARIGFDVESSGRLFTHGLQLPRDVPLARCNLAIAATLGANAEPRPEEISFDADDIACVETLLAEHDVPSSSRLIVIHPGSNWQSKLWYADRFARVADAIAAGGDSTIVFVGTAREAGEVEAARQRMKSPSVSLVGKTSLTELAALCARCALFIGTDSGPRNVAGAVGARSVVLVSAQVDTSRWFGYRPAETALRAEARCIGCYYSRCAHRLCMAAISEGDVLDLALRGSMLGRPSAPSAPIIGVQVPDSLYAAVAGRPDADCSTLRRLARSPAS